MGPGRSRCVRRPRGAGGLGQEHTGTGLATIWAIIILAENNNHTFRYRALNILPNWQYKRISLNRQSQVSTCVLLKDAKQSLRLPPSAAQRLRFPENC
jgi:hypothetical protein